MSLIYDVTSTLTQTALDAYCQKYHIPDTVHPELLGPNQNTRNSPAGKIGVYTSSVLKVSGTVLYLVGLSHYYDLDDNAMLLLLLVKMVGPVVQAAHGDQNDSIENIGHDGLNEESGDANQGDRSEGNDHVGQYETTIILVDEDVQAAAADKPKGKRKKRRATGGASGSNHPSKKLREDRDTSGNIGVAATTTVPFITSSVTPTAKHEGGGDTDSISRLNLRTQHPSERFVISSDSSQHSSTNAVDAE
ncbi:hypothetical protein Tco_1495713, partial [Tanacetum coccineum]